MRAAILLLILIASAQATVLHYGYEESIMEYRRRERYQNCLKICVNKSKRVEYNEILCSECSQLLEPDDLDDFFD